MNVLMVASECAPLIKTGGLADVVGALPSALAETGVSCKTLIPAYASLADVAATGRVVAELPGLPGGDGKILAVDHAGLDLLLLDLPGSFARAGNPYLGPDGKDWQDNYRRFASLAMAGARLAVDGVDGWKADVVHAHDWQAALVPVYLEQMDQETPKTVLTVHNLAFHGQFSPHVLGELGLRGDWFTPEKLEFYGQLNFLKGGLTTADKISTVSPTYAQEILTSGFGCGLDGVLRARQSDLVGILNGIDTEVWNPSDDGALVEGYDVRSLARKAKTREAIQTRLGMDIDHNGPLFCVISRLTEQKGLDLLLEAIPHLVAEGGQLAVLGSGAPEFEAGYKAAAENFPGKVGVFIGYDEAFSHELQGGSDAIIIPSRFEPCGLTQLYGLRYGTLPVVTQTGGLADTVIDANTAAMAAGVATGFKLYSLTTPALNSAISRACQVYADKKAWAGMQRAAMKQPVGWETSAAQYAEMYQSLN